MSKDATAWAEQAGAMAMEGRALIGGELVEAADGRHFASISPLDGRVLRQVACCSEPEVDAAVTAARRAFEQGVWAGQSPRERKAVLLRWAQLIRAHGEELALLETLDSGKPIADTLNGDIPASAYCLEWFAEAIDKLPGEVVPSEAGILGLVTREPVGVVAAVVPWNYPLLMATWKYAPALAAGNSVILKPSEKSPLSAIRVAQLALEAGLPSGVLNVVPGDGHAGELLSLHHGVDCLAFTGSGAVGRRILECAARSNLKRVWLELGGKSPHIVMPDYPDLERVAQSAAAGIFTNMGEVCSAGSRLLVHRDIKKDLLFHLVEAAEQYRPGNPLDPATRMGAIIDQAQLQRVMRYIDYGQAEASLLCGGSRVRQDSGGFYVEPTIFDRVDPGARIAREEIFGPVLSVIEFDTPEQALAIANDSEYGLAAGIWSRDMGTVHTMARKLRAGTVWVNGYDEVVDMNFPFGGFKQSGNGRDNSLHALEKYMEVKSTIIRLH